MDTFVIQEQLLQLILQSCVQLDSFVNSHCHFTQHDAFPTLLDLLLEQLQQLIVVFVQMDITALPGPIHKCHALLDFTVLLEIL